MAPEVVKSSQRSRLSGRWSLVLRMAVSALLLVYLFHRFRWPELWRHIREASPGWLLAGWLLWGVPIVLTGIRWWLLLRAQNVRIAIRKVLAITCIGQFFNAFLLGATGGDAAKVFYVIREAPDAKVRAGISILVDRAVGLLMLAVVALAAVSTEWDRFMTGPGLRGVVWALMAILTLALAGVAAVLALPLDRLCSPLPAGPKLSAAAAWFRTAALQYLRAPALLGAAAGISVAVHLLSIAGGYCAVRAVGMPVGYASVAVILPVVFFIISVPVTVSGHGLRESAFILMFGLFHVGPASAVVYSLIYFGFGLAWSLACGLVYLAFRGQSPAPGQQSMAPRYPAAVRASDSNL